MIGTGARPITSITPVAQTKFGNEEGNCWPACLATLLGVPLEEVDVIDGTQLGWWEETQALVATYGYTLFALYPGSDWLPADMAPRGYAIAGGTSTRGFSRGHAIVVYDGKPVHDPHPSGGMIPDVQEYYVLLPLIRAFLPMKEEAA